MNRDGNSTAIALVMRQAAEPRSGHSGDARERYTARRAASGQRLGAAAGKTNKHARCILTNVRWAMGPEYEMIDIGCGEGYTRRWADRVGTRTTFVIAPVHLALARTGLASVCTVADSMCAARAPIDISTDRGWRTEAAKQNLDDAVIDDRGQSHRGHGETRRTSKDGSRSGDTHDAVGYRRSST